MIQGLFTILALTLLSSCGGEFQDRLPDLRGNAQEERGVPGNDGENGQDGEQGIPGNNGENGENGEDGEDGENGENGVDGVTLVRTWIPIRGECWDMGDGVWIENEGDHADLYNNSDCDHGPDPKEVLCNDLEALEVCWVGQRQFSLRGEFGDMEVFVLSFP